MTTRATPEGTSRTRYLTRPGGRIAYDVTGTGPLVICAPGMGDVRFVYRRLVPRLVEAGYRVATMDLRGHGESDATFDAYDDPATGEDLLALTGQLDGPAVVVGNSMSAAAAAWAAAEDPGAIAGLVLIGPFVRDVPIGWAALLALRIGLRRPWGPSVWTSYYARLYPGLKPADLADHQAHIRAALARPGAWRAFLATTHTTHTAVEARLAQVQAPTLVVMGEADPDFPDPAAEARLVAGRLNGRTLLVPGAGHYPQAQHPDLVAPEIARFLGEVLPRA
ncbi:alpha/beta fold hydrolase [Streptomyces camelliae]|uniref:Alpha/beta hydrolase n=1 Tax=Streptomyces camelliae TaxID=3004093 RepID=A0ABY7P053_9ACTN|nr:alpha/beta hydrolase [Streptomyces sp. HUAS 2-6]WBO63864.1 alpha/beta hydrolase [Streptomyces sp. HUAS 2-6]